MADVRTELSSSKMFEKGSENLSGGVVGDTTYNFMTASFKTNEYLEDSGILGISAPLIYQMHLIQEDMADVYAQISKSQHTNEEMTYKNVAADYLKVTETLTGLKTADMVTASIDYLDGEMETETNLTVGGSILPKAGGLALGAAKQRWGKIYVASTIDSSGSLQVDFTSGSAGDGMIITGSLDVSGSNTFNVQGPAIITGSFIVTTGSAASNDGNFLVPHGNTRLKELTTTSTFNLGGNIIPTTKGLTIGGTGKTERFSKIYLASTIDVSGSQLHIQPSQSMTVDDFSVVVSGSMIPGDLNTGSIGTLAEPFKDLYVQSGSIHFADITKTTGGRNWGAQSDAEREVHTTRFGKEELDKLYNGEPLQPQGHLSASGDLYVSGSSMHVGLSVFDGVTHIKGMTHLSGSTHVVGDLDVLGGFKVNGNTMGNFQETIEFARSLMATDVTDTEFDYLDGVTSSIQTQLNTKATISGVKGDLNPDTDGARDLGSIGKEWQDLHLDGTAYVDRISNSGNTSTVGFENAGIHVLGGKNGTITISSLNTNPYVVSAGQNNMFIVTTTGNIHGIEGNQISGEIVTFICKANVTFHHQESTVKQGYMITGARGRDITVIADTAVRFVYYADGSKNVGKWYRV